jgi:hypothetical protein
MRGKWRKWQERQFADFTGAKMNVAEELNKLQNLYDNTNVPPEKSSIDKYETFMEIMPQFSVTELNALAVEYALSHPQIHHLNQCETPDNLLGPILSTRCGKLNRAIEFTPLEIERYLHINERVECCLKKAADEIQALASQLDKRVKKMIRFSMTMKLRFTSRRSLWLKMKKQKKKTKPAEASKPYCAAYCRNSPILCSN